MLSEQIAELELEKPKKCEKCKYYIQHYGRTVTGVYFKLYTGHCTCGVPVKQRRGKKEPTPDDTCSCFLDLKQE